MGDASDFYEGCEENKGFSQDGIEEWEEETMEVDIKVKMGAKTCGECPINHLGGLCSLFSRKWLEKTKDCRDYLRCPECLSKYGTDGLANEGRYPDVADVHQKYGTGDKPDPRDAVVAAAREPCACGNGPHGMHKHYAQCPVGIALAALDAEGGKG